jgi:hypothetical protein
MADDKGQQATTALPKTGLEEQMPSSKSLFNVNITDG